MPAAVHSLRPIVEPIIIGDGRSVKRGKAPAKNDARTLQFHDFASTDLPPPQDFDWTSKASSDFGTMLNDKLGDCTCAAIAHMIQCWSAANGKEITLSDDDVLSLYKAACGYDPNDDSTDRGGVEIDVLNYVRQYGIGGYKIDAFVALNPKNHIHVRQAAFLGGGLYTGFALPSTANNQDLWHPALGGTEQGGNNNDATPASWGGHAVAVEAADETGLTCITWGQKKRMTWSFWDAYCDEAYMAISELWTNGKGRAPSGFDYAALMSAITKVTG